MGGDPDPPPPLGRMASSTLLSDFLPTLSMMAVSLLVGYICARTRLTPPLELQGFAKIVGLFALPALLFKTLAETDLRAVEWRFVGGMALVKALVFVLAVGLTFLGERRRGKLGPGRRCIEAGLRGKKFTSAIFRSKKVHRSPPPPPNDRDHGHAIQ